MSKLYTHYHLTYSLSFRPFATGFGEQVETFRMTAAPSLLNHYHTFLLHGQQLPPNKHRLILSNAKHKLRVGKKVSMRGIQLWVDFAIVLDCMK